VIPSPQVKIAIENGGEVDLYLHLKLFNLHLELCGFSVKLLLTSPKR
jgi:hypothetical protein